jgi:hypothetical protein
MKMWSIRALLVLVLWPVGAAAQVVEVGAGIGRGCTGDSSGFCGDHTSAMWAVHGSIWLTERLELGARLTVLPLPDISYQTSRDDRFNLATDPAIRALLSIDVNVSDRRRQLVNVEALWHFAPRSALRGFLGAGLGQRSERFDRRCAPSGCETLLPMLSGPVGRQSFRGGNLTIIAGVSVRVARPVLVRGGVRLHNFAGEGTSTTEVFMTAGYQFGRR